MDPGRSLTPLKRERERERERECCTGILFEEPNPTGSRPRGLIGLYMHLFKRETEMVVSEYWAR